MRIWDIDPGFLNTQSLLGEHRELHGMYSIISKGKSGYSRHPETLRWKSYLPALVIRHELLLAEMQLRGFNHHSPLDLVEKTVEWPPVFIDHPGIQYSLLRTKYMEKKPGRIPLPANTHELWAAYKYSVMARDPVTYKNIGQLVANKEISFDYLAEKLVLLTRTLPSPGRLTNALFHMWGYIANYSTVDPQQSTNINLLQEIQEQSQKHAIDYLLHSTALGELKLWCN